MLSAVEALLKGWGLKAKCQTNGKTDNRTRISLI